MFYTLFDILKVVLIFNIERLTYSVQQQKSTYQGFSTLGVLSSIGHSAAAKLLRSGELTTIQSGNYCGGGFISFCFFTNFHLIVWLDEYLLYLSHLAFLTNIMLYLSAAFGCFLSSLTPIK
jgi:hypothetical protein